jgi:betaine-aldehyde dehydrogenase
VGEVITTSPDVDMVAFTGSTATGRRIMEAASATLKPTFLELGGKSVNLLLDDADFEKSLPGAVTSCMHGGQGCAIASRILVPRGRYDEAVDLVRAGFDSWSYGDPTDTSVLQGPQISRKQQDRVLGYIEKGKAEGARLVTGGGVPAHLPKGFFVEPTLFGDVDNGMTIAREEIFGPVMCVLDFDDEAEAIARANATEFGLSGGVFTADLTRAHRVADRLEAGTLWINTYNLCPVEIPFGGSKQSGFGRENSVAALEHYSELKTVYVGMGKVEAPY